MLQTADCEYAARVAMCLAEAGYPHDVCAVLTDDHCMMMASWEKSPPLSAWRKACEIADSVSHRPLTIYRVLYDADRDEPVNVARIPIAILPQGVEPWDHDVIDRHEGAPRLRPAPDPEEGR